MRKLAQSLLLILFFATGMVLVGNAQAATEVNGVISSNTVWTKANSPYNLTGPLGVANGANLTIEAGVTVNLNGNYIAVNGTLYARGSNSDPVYIKGDRNRDMFNNTIFFAPPSSSWNELTFSGCIIEKTVLEATVVYIDKTSPKINNNTFWGSAVSIITESQGAPIISNNTFIATNATASFTFGIGCDGKATISDNRVFGWPQSGIHVFYGSPIVRGNLIFNNTFGISVSSLTNDWSIPNPLIENNSIIYNSIGVNIIGGPAPKIFYNNIQHNSNYSISFFAAGLSGFFPKQDIDATHNWWGTTNTALINQTIYDSKNNSNFGKVIFTPFLDQQNLYAPEYPPPETIPELSPAILALIIAITLLLALLCRRH